MDPNEIIDAIVDAIDYAEMAQDPQGLVKARRLLNNDLRQAIDWWIQNEVDRARSTPTLPVEMPYELYTELRKLDLHS